MSNITVFLPMRKGSQRIKCKNIKRFADIKGGLTFIKISQLLKSTKIKQIIVSTDDEEVKNIARGFNNNKIIIDDRPEYLASSNTSTDELINYVPNIIKSGVVLWTHVTSPFVTDVHYDNMILKYNKNINKYDSLMSVTKVQKFLWKDDKPLNYDRNIEKWPRTQTIDIVYEINSAAFIADIEMYKQYRDRIGNKPFFYELNEKEAFDIDWKEDFEIAEALWLQNVEIMNS